MAKTARSGAGLRAARRTPPPHRAAVRGGDRELAPWRRRVHGRDSAQPPSDAESILGTPDASLLDIVDNVLSKGVVLTGDVTIGLAQVDLVYARLSLLLCAADRVLPNEDEDVITRHSRRHAARVRASRGSGIGDRGSGIRSNRKSRITNHE